MAALVAGLFWFQYIAAEPFARRYWPDSLISLTRLLTGRVRDPLVASNVLVGLLFLVGYGAVTVEVPGRMQIPDPPSLGYLGSIAEGASGFAAGITAGMVLTAMLFFLYLLLRVLVRKDWIAVAIFLVPFAFLYGLFRYDPGVGSGIAWQILGKVLTLLLFPVAVWILRRFGLLTLLLVGGLQEVIYLPFALPATPESWFSGRVWFVLMLFAAAAAWALWVIVNSRQQPSTESAV